MTHADVNNLDLSAFNGMVLILAGFCLVFLLLHLRSVGHRYHLSLWKWIWRPKVGMELAVAAFVICLGEAGTRVPIWIWRYVYGGEPAALGSFNPLLIIGAFLLAAGFLCQLRVISRPYGVWPVWAALASVLAYLATFISLG